MSTTLGAVTNLHEISATPHSITLGWSPPAGTNLVESVEGTLVELPGPLTLPSEADYLVDSLLHVWSLTPDHHINIDGTVDTRTGSSVVDVLYYHNKLVWQENSKGTWYYTASPNDTWHPATGPIVTHFTVIAELLTLKGMLGKGSIATQTNLLNRIVTDVSKLMP